MAGVEATIELNIRARHIGAGDLGNPSMLATIEEVLQFSQGTAGVGQANVLFSDERTLLASANEDLDLAGAIADAFGANIAAAELVALCIVADDGNTNNVNVSQPASNGVPGIFLAAGDGVAIAPGMPFLWVNRNGVAVTAGTGDKINVANSSAGTPVTYRILAIGRTVAA